MTIIRLALLCAVLGFLPAAADSRSAASQADAISALRQGGHVIVFRHGATHADQAEPTLSIQQRRQAAPAQ